MVTYIRNLTHTREIEFRTTAEARELLQDAANDGADVLSVIVDDGVGTDAIGIGVEIDPDIDLVVDFWDWFDTRY
jgi:hypothetical protein